MTGQRVGKYEVLAQLTAGGMAQLFLGCTQGPGGFRKYVVIKRILPDALGDENFERMFLDEARITAAFSHPAIAQVFDLGEDKQGLYVVMEFIAGQNLNQVVQACAKQAAVLPIGFSVSVVFECAQALHYAHTFKSPTGEESPVIHRDVAQKNIMVTYDGQVKLLDFGIAKAKNALARTKAGTVKGTAGYMSPEQVRGDPLDGRSDVFSLGVVLWEMATGRRLFAAETELEELRMILDGQITPPHEVEPSVPPELGQIIMKALARDLDQRFASAKDFARTLQLKVPDLLFDADERAGFMKERFAQKIASTRKLFEANEDSAVDAAVEAFQRESTRDAEPPPAPRKPKPRSPTGASAGKLAGVSSKMSAGKLAPVKRRPSVEKLEAARSEDKAIDEALRAEAAKEAKDAQKSSWLGFVVGALVLGAGAFFTWKVVIEPDSSHPVTQPGSTGLAAIPGAEPVEVRDARADEPVVKNEPRPDPKPDPKPDKPAVPKAKGDVTLAILPEATVSLGKQQLGKGSMMTFSLPVGTHLVTVVGPDGVKRKLSLRVTTGKNTGRYRIDDIPAE